MAKRRNPPNQAKVRSMIQRLGTTWNPWVGLSAISVATPTGFQLQRWYRDSLGRRRRLRNHTFPRPDHIRPILGWYRPHWRHVLGWSAYYPAYRWQVAFTSFDLFFPHPRLDPDWCFNRLRIDQGIGRMFVFALLVTGALSAVQGCSPRHADSSVGNGHRRIPRGKIKRQMPWFRLAYCRGCPGDQDGRKTPRSGPILDPSSHLDTRPY